jgi:hypothetical protein
MRHGHINNGGHTAPLKICYLRFKRLVMLEVGFISIGSGRHNAVQGRQQATASEYQRVARGKGPENGGGFRVT